MFCSWMLCLVFSESSRFQIGVANNEMAGHALCPVWSSTIVQECSEAIRDILVTPFACPLHCRITQTCAKTKRLGEKNTSTWHCLYAAARTQKKHRKGTATHKGELAGNHTLARWRTSPLYPLWLTATPTACRLTCMKRIRSLLCFLSHTHTAVTISHRHTHVHIHICNNIKAFILRPLLPTQINQITHLWIITHRLGTTD